MSNYTFKISQLPKYKTFLETLKNSNHAIILFSKDKLLLDAVSSLYVMMQECENDYKPCMFCETCQKIIDRNALDVEYFGEDKNIMVDDSENIVNSSYVVPYEFKNKYFVLKNFNDATIQAQNKLLKVIEEPQSFDKFLLLVNNLDAVLSTIKSRCQIYTVPKFSIEELKSIFDFEVGQGKKVSFGAQFADGNLTALNNIYSDEEFEEIYSLCIKILTNLKTSRDVLEYSSLILKYKEKLNLVLEILCLLYRDLLAIKQDKQNLVHNKEQINVLLVLANSEKELALVNIIKEIEGVKQKLKYNANINGVIDNLLLKILEIKYICK